MFFSWGMGLSQKPSVSLITNYESAIIITTVKEAFLIIYNSHQHHRSWTSTWFPAAAWTSDIHKFSGRSMEYKHQHSLQRQHESQISTINMVSCSHPAHGHQHGLRQQEYLLAKQFLSPAFKVWYWKSVQFGSFINLHILNFIKCLNVSSIFLLEYSHIKCLNGS